MIGMENMRLGIVGFGAMGRAVCEGLARGDYRGSLYVLDPAPETKLRATAIFSRAVVCGEPWELVRRSRIIFFCVPREEVELVAEALATHSLEGKLIITLTDGLSGDRLKTLLGTSAVIWAAANTAVSLGRGLIAVAQDREAAESPLYTAAMDILSSFGRVIPVNREDMPAVTALVRGTALAALLVDSYHTAAHRLLGKMALSEEVTLGVFESVLSLLREMPVDGVVSGEQAATPAVAEALFRMNEEETVRVLSSALAALEDGENH